MRLPLFCAALAASVTLSACLHTRTPEPEPAPPTAPVAEAPLPPEPPDPPDVAEAPVEPYRPSEPAPEPAYAPMREVDGFRVQVFTSGLRETAEQIRADAASWWTSRRQYGQPEMDVAVVYQEPYYRVRMGAFATREDAETALSIIREQYPDAFLVPERVAVPD